jgi:cytochrome c oxidase assembly factor CtaG
VVTWFLYYGAMYACFAERGVYDYLVAHQLAHDASHVGFFLVGYLYWQPIIGSDATRWRLPVPARIGSIFLGMPFEAFLGISVSDYRAPIDPVNTLANTHTAGDTFWVGAMLISGLCFVAVGAQWFAQLNREGRQEDRRVAKLNVAARQKAEALGVQDGIREGWTVPWWRLGQIEVQQDRDRARAAASRQDRGGAT